ncbi:hypothetical protein EVAR_16502_1 [Eumeta japonica]|uniref:Uncharacterized protein n=1 Tax=Eumeta variegata TaxID=151549 RepID=A0A4C1UL77_EUMVA|nr:hypothetical protein EVAR_16502_1 [Eumeta japonica]
MSPLGCQYVIRTYWTDASTPAVAAGIVWLYGPKIRATLRVGQFECSGRRGSNKKRKQPAAGGEAQQHNDDGVSIRTLSSGGAIVLHMNLL